jgi:hypothetical protein
LSTGNWDGDHTISLNEHTNYTVARAKHYRSTGVFRGVQPVHRPGEEGCSAGTSARRAEASESLKGSIAVDVLFWFFHLFYWYFRLFLVYLILIINIPNLFFLRDAKVVIWIRYFYKRVCLSVRNSVLWCPIRFPHKNDVRFVFTSSCL